MSAIYDYGQRRKEEGKKEGIKEESEKIAIEMIKNDENDEKIKKYTNITDEKIKELKNKLKL